MKREQRQERRPWRGRRGLRHSGAAQLTNDGVCCAMLLEADPADDEAPAAEDAADAMVVLSFVLGNGRTTDRRTEV